MTALTDEEVLARLEPLIQRAEAGCWLWKGPYVEGHPDLRIGSRHIRVRRWLYQHSGGQVSNGQTLAPLCTRQECVAPEHAVVRRRLHSFGAVGGLSGTAPGEYAGPIVHRRPR